MAEINFAGHFYSYRLFSETNKNNAVWIKLNL